MPFNPSTLARELAHDYVTGAVDESFATTVSGSAGIEPAYDSATMEVDYNDVVLTALPAVVKRYTQEEIDSSSGTVTGDDWKVVIEAHAFDTPGGDFSLELLGNVVLDAAGDFPGGQVVKVTRRLAAGIIVLQVRR